MLAKMVTIRQKLDRAPKQTSIALSESAADHRKVITIDPDGNYHDIGAILRQQRIDDGEVAQNQAAKSRLGRWMQRTKLSSPGIQDSLAKTDDVVTSGSIWLAIFEEELFFVKVIGALKHYRGGKKPCKDVLLKDLEVVQLQTFDESDDANDAKGTFKHDDFVLIKTAQQLLTLVPSEFIEHQDPYSFRFKDATKAESLMNKFEPIVREYWDKVVKKAARNDGDGE